MNGPAHNSDESSKEWSATQRTVATIAILFFLFVIVIAPLSNPIASASLTAPLSRSISPLHQALYLGHGYRFFGPDPGPSHLVEYKVHLPDESVVEGRIPDAQTIWPRLRYHRWFMLSETIFEEHRFTPDPVGFEKSQQELMNEIVEMRNAGAFSVVKKLERESLRQQDQYDNATRRIEEIVDSLADYLARQNGGTDTELYLRERLIAAPQEVMAGVELDDPRYLSEPIRIGSDLEQMPEVGATGSDPVQPGSRP